MFINLAADDKDYLFVLSKPLSDQLNIMGIGIDALESNQPLQIISSNFLTQLNVNGISKLMFHRKRKVFGKRTNLSSALKLSSGTHDYDYIYRVILKEEYVESLIRAVQSLDSFIHIQPNYKYTITTTKADAVAEPRYSIQQTGIELMNFPDVWDVANGSGIVVAVLDTGLKIDHEEFCPSAGDPDNDVAVSDATTDYLNGCVKVVHPQDMVYSASFSSVSQIVPGEDYYTRDSYPGDDYSGHGTHVSGIIGASVNDNGIAGAAFGAQIMPVRVMYSIYDDLGNITTLADPSVVDEIQKQYVITARSKGLKEKEILYGHVFRNAMLIVIAGFPAVFIGVFFGGSLIIETIFSLDGLGRMGFEAAVARDYPVIFGTLFVFGLIGLTVGILSDLMYVFIDPRIDFEGREG